MNDWASTVGWSAVWSRFTLWRGGHVVVSCHSGMPTDLLAGLAPMLSAVGSVELTLLSEPGEDRIQIESLQRPQSFNARTINVVFASLATTTTWAKPKPNLALAHLAPQQASRFLHLASEQVAADGCTAILASLSWLRHREVHRSFPTEMLVCPDGRHAWFLYQKNRAIRHVANDGPRTWHPL